MTGDPLGLTADTTLLQTLYADANMTYVQSALRAPQSVTPQSASTFSAQVVAGTATVARPNNATNLSTGFLMSYRDPSGSCQCNFNGAPGSTLPNPPSATITAKGWNSDSAYDTVGATTVVLIAFRGANLPAPVPGPYLYQIGSTGVSASSALINPVNTLGRQSAPSVTVDTSGSTFTGVTLSWTPVAGSNEYFLNFLTTYGTGHTHVSGVAVTPHTTVFVPAQYLYSGATYQVLLIASDQQWIGTLFNTSQLPLSSPFPQQIDWSVAPLAQFSTP